MNAKIIEGLKAVRGGIDLILEGYADEQSVSSSTQNEVESKNDVSSKGRKAVPVEETTSTEATTPNEVKEAPAVTREQLDGMTYNNIKKLAKGMEIGRAHV